MEHADLFEGELKSGGEDAEAVFHAAAEVDGGGLLEIFRRAGNFSDAEAEMDALRQHLVVEDEVVGVFEQGKFGQDFSAEGAISGVIFGELHAQEKILEGSEQAVGNVFIDGHAA